MKNWKVVASRRDTSVAPYQKTREITQNTWAWEKEYKRFVQIAVLFERIRGSSKLLLYKARQSASLVKEATVRMEPAASQANCADCAWAFLLNWSFRTTTRFNVQPCECKIARGWCRNLPAECNPLRQGAAYMLIDDYKFVQAGNLKHCDWHTDTDKCNFPNKSKTKDRACNKTRNTLDNGSQRDTRQTIHFLWVVAQLSS